MPTKAEDFLCLNSISYEVRPQNNSYVCKKLPIFMVKRTPFNGKVLHTSKVLI